MIQTLEFQINGFSSSIPFSVSSVDSSSEVHTFSIPTLGTSSTTTYTNPTATLTFGGTPSSNPTATNVKITIAGQQLSSVTASTSVLATYLSTVASSFVFTGNASGYSATPGTNSITFTAPYGNTNNAVALTATYSGTASFSSTLSTTFTGGANINTVSLARTNGWGGTNNFIFNT